MTNMTSIGSYAASQPPSLPAQMVAPQSAEDIDKDKAANAITKAVYFSPVVQIDPKSRIALLVFRDTETGKVKDKFSMNMDIGKQDENSAKSDDVKSGSDNKDIKQYEKTAQSAKAVELETQAKSTAKQDEPLTV